MGVGGRGEKVEEGDGIRSMEKAEKLKILDDLIDRTSKLKYDNSSLKKAVINDSLSFIRHSLGKTNASVWEKTIKRIQWSLYAFTTSTPESDFINAWNSGKEELQNILISIKKEVELYTPDEGEKINNDSEPIIFLSHSSSDKPYGNALEKFILGLGVKNDQLIYTSHPLHKIPLDANIYDYLRKNINRNVFMIILWSDEYLESPACLNEMGAAWVTQSDYTNIFTPNFHFGNPKFHECAVDTRKMGAVLSGDNHCKTNMIELKDKILSLFNLDIDEKTATFLLDEFIKEIMELNK